jgi:uncharacterized repeat protein (TIGR01451 family)
MMTARAQNYVAIPDSTFGNFLAGFFYPSCMTGDPINGWYLDNTCPAVLSDTFMEIGGLPIVDLSGIENFVNLRYLDASGMQLWPSFTVPPNVWYLDVSGQQGSGFLGMTNLDSGLLYFDCSNNPIGSLPPLPSTLQTLKCFNNVLDTLPPLPDSLQYLDVNSNYYLSTMPALPARLTYLDCHYDGLQDFTGNFPPHLTYLDCSYNGADTIPPLQNTTLQTLICSNNYLTTLPALPASVFYLDCNTNDLTALPALSASLNYLDCSTNQLTTLPLLTDSLVNVNCNNNYITALPALPPSLEIFYCNTNQLTALPALDNGLTDLDCSYNKISALPTLPPHLDTLICWQNSLTGLPALLPNTLKELLCGDSAFVTPPAIPDSVNQFALSYSPFITSLPALPASLRQLNFDYLKVTDIPVLPDSLLGFSCQGDSNLTCLPLLPTTLGYLSYANGTPITCMPNRLPFYLGNPNPNNLPLCDPMSGCIFNYNIWGNVHQDTSYTGTCYTDSLRNGLQLSGVKLQLLSGGTVLQQTYSNDGQYSFKTNGIQTYQVAIDTTADYALKVACPDSVIRTQVMAAGDTIFTHQDFGLECRGEDEAVVAIGGRFRTGLQTYLVIRAGEMSELLYHVNCGYHPSGTITVVITGSSHYIGGDTPTYINGDTLTYIVPDFDSLYNFGNLITQTDTNAVVGSLVCVTVSISINVNDINPANNTLTQCFPIASSLDPNEKEVYPATIDQPGDWQTYTINFQNTGTDTAHNIIIRDTLSSWIDVNSFQYLASSDPKVLINLIGNAVEFYFPNIDLPDSTTSNTLSRGWIQYKVKTKTSLPLHTPVTNTASIYFDFNSAVVTNTVVSEYGPLGIKPIANSGTIHLYPNPNKGSFTLETSGSIGSEYTISDMLGNVIAQKNISSNTQSIDLPEAGEGVYTLMVTGSQAVRFVVVR